MMRQLIAMRVFSLGMVALYVFTGCGARDSAFPEETARSPLAKRQDRIDTSQGSLEKDESTSDSVEQSLQDRTANRESVIADADQLAQQGDSATAASKLKGLLVADPDDVEVLFMLANLEAAAGDLSGAVDLLDAIPNDHPEAGIPALGQSAQWCVELERYDEAQRRYREVLSSIPDAAPALRQLAYLLNRQGRRHEAADYVQELCKLGNVRQDELHSLIVLSHAMHDDPSEVASDDNEEARYPPIGTSGVARKLFTDGKFVEAAAQIHDLVDRGDAPPEVVALYGRAVVEAQDDDRFQWWLSKTDDRTQEFADYWAAVGTYLISQRRFEEATRALLEAVDRDYSDLNSAGRLVQTLSTLGREEASQIWFDRWDKINETVKVNNRVSKTKTPDPSDIEHLAGLLEELHRPLEALMWKSIAGIYRGVDSSKLAQWNAQRKQIVTSQTGFPKQFQRLCGFDPAEFAMPELHIQGSVSLPKRREASPSIPLIVPEFLNVASRVGMDHAYQVAGRPQAFGFAIYQTWGGAVVALDYDRDGWCDLFLTQGGAEPPTFIGQQSDQLYRQSKGKLFDVTSPSGTENLRYALGATAGDWNQDGFPDLVVSCIGADLMWINNGDGTFTQLPSLAPPNWNRVPSSLAMADLTGDSLPDIFSTSYVDDPSMIALPKRNGQGEVLGAMAPLQFEPGADRLFENDARGNANVRTFTTEPKDVRLGLGIVVTDFNDKPGNEAFVGNDVCPDHLWVQDRSTGDWSDIGPAAGCAFGIRGSKTATMGIAASDFDGSGTIDLHITNFQDRNASLFLNLGDAFLERNVQYGLAADSQAVLGFGTQAIDYDNDGDRDIVVTNGHIEKSLTIDAPFEQPAQLFCNLGGRFQLMEVQDPSRYWAAQHLGRGLARLDFNRDGKSDFVITHLGERTALMINETNTTNHWLQLVLVGVTAERDAIGAKVQIRFDGKQATDWVIAGDGYFCRNEAVVSFGLGESDTVEEVAVTWPSGAQQRIENVAADQRMLIVEGQEAFDLD